MYSIKIKEEKKSLFGQYIGEYLSSNEKIVRQGGTYGGGIICKVNKGNELTINTDSIQNKELTIGNIYNFEGIFSIYALNPILGSVLNVTKIIK